MALEEKVRHCHSRRGTGQYEDRGRHLQLPDRERLIFFHLSNRRSSRMNVSKIFAPHSPGAGFSASRRAGTPVPTIPVGRHRNFSPAKNVSAVPRGRSGASTLYVCPNCGVSSPGGRVLSSEQWCWTTALSGNWTASWKAKNVLAFPGYDEKLTKQRAKTGLNDAVVTAYGKIGGIPAVVGRYWTAGSLWAVWARPWGSGSPAPWNMPTSKRLAADHLLGQRRRPHAGRHLSA